MVNSHAAHHPTPKNGWCSLRRQSVKIAVGHFYAGLNSAAYLGCWRTSFQNLHLLQFILDLAKNVVATIYGVAGHLGSLRMPVEASSTHDDCDLRVRERSGE
jgi:hypothetical protein